MVATCLGEGGGVGAPSGARSLAPSPGPPLARDAGAPWGLGGGGLFGEGAGGARILEVFVRGFAARMGVLCREPFSSVPAGDGRSPLCRWRRPELEGPHHVGCAGRSPLDLDQNPCLPSWYLMRDFSFYAFGGRPAKAEEPSVPHRAVFFFFFFS